MGGAANLAGAKQRQRLLVEQANGQHQAQCLAQVQLRGRSGSVGARLGAQPSCNLPWSITRFHRKGRLDERQRKQSTGTLRVVRAGDRCPDQASGAMLREAAIAAEHGRRAEDLAGYVELGPGLVSAVHHHGEAESGIYIISGDARFYSGDALDVGHDAHAGDFVWVPPHLVHVEMNTSQTEPVRMVVARSTQAALTFNLPTPAGWQPTA